MDQLPNPWWIFVLLGVCAGILSGSMGLGSGIIIVPTLVLLCGFAQKSAQGTALAVMVPMALFGALRYWKNPDIEMNGLVIVLIVCGALAGTLIGTELAFRLQGHVLKKIFAVVLIIVAVKMFIGSSGPKQSLPDNSLTEQTRSNLVEPGGTNNESGQQ
jgi:uncharacterized membrane protein YfcA